MGDDEVRLPPTEIGRHAIAVSITDLDAGVPIFHYRQAIVYEDALFAGSGAHSADECWSLNRCAKRAVKTASLVDICTGGGVKYHHFDGRNNVDNTSRYEDINKQLFARGHAMTGIAKPMPIQEAAAVDERVRKLLDDIAEGKESLCAPFPGMNQPWSDEERRRLAKAIMQVKGRKA